MWREAIRQVIPVCSSHFLRRLHDAMGVRGRVTRGLMFALLAPHGLMAAQAQEQERVLVPWETIAGGQLAVLAESDGEFLRGGTQGYVSLVSPSSVAVRGPDLYVADGGARKIFRLDAAQQIMAVVPGADATSRTRLQTGADQTLFVLDAGGATVLHFSRSGELLETMSDPQDAASISDFSVEEFSGQIIASDRKSGRLLVIDPPGWSSRTLPVGEGGLAASWGVLASRGGNIYAADRNCSCIVVIDSDGRVRQHVGGEELVQPRALAVDHFGRIFVADGFGSTLAIYQGGKRVASYEARKLQLNEFSALAIDEGVLYVADGSGGQVAAFYIRPPGKTGRNGANGSENR